MPPVAKKKKVQISTELEDTSAWFKYVKSPGGKNQ